MPVRPNPRIVLGQTRPARSPAGVGPGLVGWWRSDQGLFTTAAGSTPSGPGDPVGRWEDISGNGLDATQATAGLRPTLQANAMAGYPGLVGALGIYLATAPSAALENTDVTVLCVFASLVASGGNQIGVAITYSDAGGGAGGDPLIGATFVGPTDWRCQGRPSGAAVVDSAPAGSALLCARLENDGLWIRSGLSRSDTDTGATSTRTTNLAIELIGRSIATDITLTPCLEVAVWGRELTPIEQRQVLIYAKSRYGL